MAHEHAVPSTDRAAMLITCPANAPSWAADLPHPEMSIWRHQEQLSGAAAIAADYLDGLPSDQAGQVRLDHEQGAIVVQVTRAAEQVRAELQEEVGDLAVIEMETVRFSAAELRLIAARIERLPGLRWSSIGAGGCDGRVDVMVPGDPDEARRLIEEVADPCSFAVTHGDSVPLPALATDVPSLATDQDR
jgi:hypothetical protein